MSRMALHTHQAHLWFSANLKLMCDNIVSNCLGRGYGQHVCEVDLTLYVRKLDA